MRANKLWAQVEATFKQMDTAGTELECFQALKKQEQLAATHRISNLWEEVQKQKDLERTLQKRYGDLYTELDRLQHLIIAYRLQAEREQETAAKDNDSAMDDINKSPDQSVAPDLEASKEEVAANNTDIAMEDVDAQDQRIASDVGTPREEVVAQDMVEADAAEGQLAASDVEKCKEDVVAKDMVEAEAQAEAAGDDGVAPTAEPEDIHKEKDSIEAQKADETRDQEQEVEVVHVHD